jgi:F-type H+-transporting ATPase subunit epsilon
MKLKILTPEKTIFEGEASIATLPTSSGKISILDNHTPLVSSVSQGEIKIKSENGERIFKNGGGVVQTINNQTVVLLTNCKEEN